ncbi:DsbA family protein [Kineococcus rubinsiae]|uniref:DsbA family protein n=1 Tax=Kineococcus rubinsiae TaxID=2609562 RepID=UPI001431AFD3|nr:thioredoxin domain-containing protein [Kineococcus rubinsiae]NIZ89939.1 thioredoxin domain-containing protein [Kineococcus rubinsiae]
MSSRKRPSGHPARAGEAQDARAARQAKAAALRQREQARERSRRVLLITAAVVVVLAIVATVVVLVQRQGGDSDTEGVPAPHAVSADGGIQLPGTPAAGAPTMDIWLDYQCPVCQRFEGFGGQAYVDLAAQGKAKVVVHTLTFLDGTLGTAPSSQLAAEGAAAADAQGKFVQYTQALYADQPEEGTGYTADSLQAYAEKVDGLDVTAWRKALDDHVYAGYVKRVQAQMEPQGVGGTPTVRVTSAAGAVTDVPADQLLTADAPQNLAAAVQKATAA